MNNLKSFKEQIESVNHTLTGAALVGTHWNNLREKHSYFLHLQDLLVSKLGRDEAMSFIEETKSLAYGQTIENYCFIINRIKQKLES